MDKLATVISGWGAVAFFLFQAFVVASLFVSPLADLVTKSYWLLATKVGVVLAGVALHEAVEPVWFLSGFLGLAFVSFIRAFRWFRTYQPKT
jgi:hypothetical protein